MESREEFMLYPSIPNGSGSVVSNGNGFGGKYGERGFVQEGVDEEGKGGMANVVLGDLDEYMDDITVRLAVSRMVNDSVIKGMVTAVDQAAVKRIAAKELDVADLKHYLYNKRGFSCISDACLKHEKTRGDLFALRKFVREQFNKAEKEVEKVRGANSKKKIGLGSESLGLGGILQENQCENLVHVDRMLEGLKTTLDGFCSEVDDILVSSKISLCESQEDRDVSGKIEDMVMQSVIKSLQEETNAQLDAIRIENFKGVSGLRAQLEEVQRSLCIHETKLVSYVSHDLDHFHKALVNHVGENGTVDESDVHVAESYDFQQLKHLSKEQMVGYFNDIITNLKRDHESVLERKTDKYFSLKREYLNLKERGPSTTHRKDEEFDMLRKKIPEIISKLECFLSENEKFPALTQNPQRVGESKTRLDSLLFENHQLRDSLNEKENEVNCLEAQVSGAAEALLESSLAQKSLLKLVENLNSSLEESLIGAELTEEIYKSSLREHFSETRYTSGDSNRETCGIIIREPPNRYEPEDPDIESWFMQEFSGLVFTEAVMEVRNFVETTALEKESELRMEIEENENLKKGIHDLRTALEQKETLAIELSFSLSKEREKLEVASRELKNSRELTSQLQKVVTESDMNLKLLRSQHLESLEQIEVDKIELLKAKQIIDQMKQVLIEANEERNRALTVAQEIHGKLLLSEARGAALKKEMESAVGGLSYLFADFECRISEATRKNSIRFKDTTYHLKALNKVANDLRRREQSFKQKLDTKSVNLLKAESEVDLLGDKVESLLRLLNKIYIALDHYSPILKHYPGIIEILELVKRELRGEYAVLL